ncbi:hypothetical protein [Streptomyces phaeoluteigriseus]
MRIRSALAVAVLGVALTAAGAANAAASDHFEDTDHAVCSPYFGGIETVTSELVWGGADCRSHAVGHDN